MAYPIVLFVYKRLEHVKQTINSLLDNELAKESKLYICSDGPRSQADAFDVERCRDYCRSIVGFTEVEVIELATNYNVRKAVLYMGDLMSSRHEAWISVEDDVLVHRHFLTYMNAMLKHYEHHPQVACVLGYTYNKVFDKVFKNSSYAYDVMFAQIFYAFGWGSWAHKWKKFTIAMPEKNYFKGMGSRLSIYLRSWGHMLSHRVASKPSSELWDIHFCYEMLRTNMYAVVPRSSYLKNFGYDGSGLHGYNFDANFFQEELDPKELVKVTDDVLASKPYQGKIARAVMAYWVEAFVRSFFKSVFSRLKANKNTNILPFQALEEGYER